MEIKRATHFNQPCQTTEKIDWEPYYEGFHGSRKMPDGVCDFIYHIFKNDDGTYSVQANNNAYGAERFAVKRKTTKKASKYKASELDALKKRIERGKCLWLYTGFCNRIGEVTTVEY